MTPEEFNRQVAERGIVPGKAVHAGFSDRSTGEVAWVEVNRIVDCHALEGAENPRPTKIVASFVAIEIDAGEGKPPVQILFEEKELPELIRCLKKGMVLARKMARLGQEALDDPEQKIERLPKQQYAVQADEGTRH